MQQKKAQKQKTMGIDNIPKVSGSAKSGLMDRERINKKKYQNPFV